MLLNEHFRSINEDLRFEALSQLREIQANLVSISFLPVIAIMKPENPLKKNVLAFQDKLDGLTIEIQNFISDAKNDIEYEPSEEESEDDKIEDEEPKDDVEVEDSSEPEETDKDTANSK